MANPAPLDVGRLRLLREVGLRGSIAAAARSVGLTPSAVSQQLALLERETAVALLDRSPRGVTLTGAGHDLAARAGQVLDVLEAARADLDRRSGALAGPVGIACVASAALTLVSDAVVALRRTRPGISVSVVATEPERGLGMLLGGDADIAVVDEYDYVPLALPESARVLELDVEPLVVVRPRRRGETPSPVALAELADCDWVMPPEDAACGRAVRAACRTVGFEPRVRWESDDMLVLARAVAAGHGVAVLPRRSVPGTVAAVSVTELDRPLLHRRLLAVARATVAARPVVAATLGALGEACRT